MVVAFINGNVYCVDSEKTVKEAFLVNEDGTFGAVGTTKDVLAAGGDDVKQVVDLKGQFVMPGMHDSHSHLLMASEENIFQAQIGPDFGPEEIVETLKNFNRTCCNHVDTVSNWLVGNYYHCANFKDGKPDRKFLDDAFGDQPVVIRDYTTHNIFANTAALRAAGYEENPVDPWDGYFVRREDGTITGELIEGAATKIFTSLPKGRPEDNVTALAYGVRMSNRFGFTTVQEAAANTVYLNAAKKLDDANKLTINLKAHVVWYSVGSFSAESNGSLHHTVYKSYVEQFKSKHFDPTFTKCWLDGVPGDPHETHCPIVDDKPDMSKILIPPETFKKGIERFDAEGRTCKIHCCGQGSVRYALDCIEEIRKRNPNGPKHELAHNMDITDHDLKRYGKLNVTAEMSPAVWHNPEFQPETFPKAVYPFNQLLDNGALVTIGSDWVFAPDCPNIFPALQAITEFKHGWNLTRKQALDLVTINGARAIGAEHQEGSIESGKVANFIVLDRDLLQATDIATTIVKKTYFEGKLVYDYESDELKEFQGKPFYFSPQ